MRLLVSEYQPTATQLVRVTHDVPTRLSCSPGALGLGFTDQVEPSQVSINVWLVWKSELSVFAPTETQKLMRGQDTPVK